MKTFFSWFAGIVATVIAGLTIYFFTAPPPIKPPPRPPEPSNTVIVRFDRIGGPFKVLGPNPGGKFAGRPGTGNGAWWYKFTISIFNDCREGRFHVSPGDVVLYFASTNEIPGNGANSPTRDGREYQPKRLQSKWVAPGETSEGELIYEIWDNQYDFDPNGSWPFMRVRSDFTCPVRYLPR